MGELTMSGILINVLLIATSSLNIILFVSSRKFGEMEKLLEDIIQQKMAAGNGLFWKSHKMGRGKSKDPKGFRRHHAHRWPLQGGEALLIQHLVKPLGSGIAKQYWI